jgi:hypothetical protein
MGKEISKKNIAVALKAVKEQERILFKLKTEGPTTRIREAASIDREELLEAWGELESMLSADHDNDED